MCTCGIIIRKKCINTHGGRIYPLAVLPGLNQVTSFNVEILWPWAVQLVYGSIRYKGSLGIKLIVYQLPIFVKYKFRIIIKYNELQTRTKGSHLLSPALMVVLP